MTSIRILQQRVDAVTFPEALAAIQSLVQSPSTHQVVTANTLMLLAAERDTELADVIENASLVVPESWGVSWASRRQDQPIKEFIPGIDLFMALCGWAAGAGRSIYLLGAKPGIAERAGETLQKRYPGLRVAGSHHGYFSKEDEPSLLKKIQFVRPDFLFVGMNVPAQDKWIARNHRAAGARVTMGVGGSFDVLSGELKRAPLWIRQLGVEWAYRTLQEPWRIRRIKDLPVFMWKVLRPPKKEWRT